MRGAILVSLLVFPTLAVAEPPSIAERVDSLEYRSSEGRTTEAGDLEVLLVAHERVALQHLTAADLSPELKLR